MPVAETQIACPLCSSCSTEYFWADKFRSYFHCLQCALVFVPKTWHLSPEEEKRHYDTHQNSPEDEQYRKFLSRLFCPVSEYLNGGAVGLDFGCGPGPTLSVMFDEAGFDVDLYDHYYYQDPEVLQRNYDFITASEVIEHLSDPGTVLYRLWQQLKPGGCLGLMSKRVVCLDAFKQWHYKNDPTHISFFSDESFYWLGEQLNAKPCFEGADVVLFQKALV